MHAVLTRGFACACSSVVRNFRYVATLTAQQIVTSLVGACALLGEARETAQRQLTAEKSKKGSKVSNKLQSPSITHAQCTVSADCRAACAGASMLL